MTQSLNGLRILNTRPKDQAKMLSKQINDAGGIAIECPTLKIEKTENEWLKSLPDLNLAHLAIFISANAVQHCFTELNHHKIPWPSNIKVIAIGSGSAKALEQFNIRVDEIPKIPNSEYLLKLKCLHEPKNQSVLLFKGEGGRTLIEEMLALKGAHLFPVSVYKRVLPDFSEQFINSLWREDVVDIILLTSEQSMHNLFKLFGEEAHAWLKQKPYIVISQRLARITHFFGLTHVIVSHPDRMMSSLFDYYQGLPHDQQ